MGKNIPIQCPIVVKLFVNPGREDVQKKIIIDVISNGKNICSMSGYNCKAEFMS